MSVDTQDTAFDQIGGAARIDALVEAFYDLIETDPAYAELRAMHAADMTPVRASLKGWMSGWLGGPALVRPASGRLHDVDAPRHADRRGYGGAVDARHAPGAGPGRCRA